MRGRQPLLLLCTVVGFSASCETGTFNPWLSPAQVEVEGECDVFTGRIVADEWAGRPIKTKHGVRYRASALPIRLPATVQLIVAETWQPGACPEAPKLQEIPVKTDIKNHMLPEPTFTASRRGEEGVKTLVVRGGSVDPSSLFPEKSFPWPFWPFTHHGRPNIRLRVLEVELGGPQASTFELQACITEHCSVLEWPAKSDGNR